MNRNAYTPITADPVLLRLNSCRDWGTLHQRIRKAFGFPDYYGENWDAMWDCLTDVICSRCKGTLWWRALTPCRRSCGRTPLRCRRSSATFRRNILGSRSHTADYTDNKACGQPERGRTLHKGCPSSCYALIACAALRQHTFFTGYCTFSSYRRGSAC